MIRMRGLPCDAGRTVMSTGLWKMCPQQLSRFSCGDSRLLSDEKKTCRSPFGPRSRDAVWGCCRRFPLSDFDSRLEPSPIRSLARSSFHTTSSDRAVEDGLRLFGTPIGVLGVIGPGIGLGILGHGLAMAVARNPSASKEIFGNSILALLSCEFMGLLAFMLPLILKFL